MGREAQLRLDGADEAWLAGTGLTGNGSRPIVAGIRPESFYLEEQSTVGHSIPATVQVVEPLGSMMDVYLVLSSGKRVVSRVPAGNLSEGKSISARVNPTEIHLFEPTTTADPYGQSLRAATEQLV